MWSAESDIVLLGQSYAPSLSSIGLGRFFKPWLSLTFALLVLLLFHYSCLFQLMRHYICRLKNMENTNMKLLQALRNSGAEKIVEAYDWLQRHRNELKEEVYGPVLLEVFLLVERNAV